jgi:exopolysaccharide biosynthesis polyprenyl glycosylphosphotransferase
MILAQVVFDIVLINVAFALAYYLRYEQRFLFDLAPENYVPYSAYVPFSLALTVVSLIIFSLEGLYTPRRGRTWFEEVYALITGTFTAIVLMVAFFFFYRPLFYSRLIFAYYGIFIVALLAAGRLVARAGLAYLRKRGIGVDRILIVGAGEVGRAIMRNIVAEPGLGYQVVGFVDDDPEKGTTDLGRFKALGPTGNLPRLLRELRVDEVVVTLPWHTRDLIMRMLEVCETAGVRAKIVPDLFELSLSRVAVDAVGGIPLIGVRETTIRGWNLAVKRVMDLIIAIGGLILLSPFLAFLALLIRLDSPGPIIFRQTRVGRGGKLFVAYKFRTMRVGAEEEREELAALNEATGPLFKIRNDPRLTRVGKVLRRLSWDEWPQLVNVARGEMSIVGPRPPLPSEVEQYREWHKKRLEVSPGMTGMWQVSGRSEVTFDEMVMLDIYYIENWSPWLDMWIALKTIPTVVLARGAY